MEIKIINLGLKDFKGTKDRAVSFGGKNANIYGRNYTGKSTIAVVVNLLSTFCMYPYQSPKSPSQIDTRQPGS